MTAPNGNIILMADDRELCDAAAERLDEPRVYRVALEALADLATRPARALVTEPRILGHRTDAILRAIRFARPEMPLYVLCRSEDEPAARATDADDYFIHPLGLDELVSALASPAARRRSGLADAQQACEGGESAAPPQTATTSDALPEALRQISRAAGGSAGQVADTAVRAALAFRGVNEAAVLSGRGGNDPLLAASDETERRFDWSPAIAAVADRAAPRDTWYAAAPLLYLMRPRAADGRGPALAVRVDSEHVDDRVLEELADAARVALALVGAAQDREAALKVLSSDPETGLSSRRYIEHYLPALCRLAAESRREVVLALIAPRGDASLARSALRPLAALLRTSFTESKLARTGELELAVVFAGESSGDVADRLRSLMSSVDQAALGVSAALGAASFPWQTHDADGLWRVARRHLAESLSSGRPVFAH